MQASWKGAITFGLISIPVRLYSAVQEKSLKFHLLHDEDGGRIKYQRTCAECGKEVELGRHRQGLRVLQGPLRPVHRRGARRPSTSTRSGRSTSSRSFRSSRSIPIYFNKTYYVAPEPSGIKAYKLLAEALEAEGQVGIAKVALREKEHLATIRLKDDVFVLETMYWPDEIREPEFEELDKKRRGARHRGEDGSPARAATLGRVQTRGVRGRLPRAPRRAGRRRSRAKRSPSPRPPKRSPRRSSTSWRPSRQRRRGEEAQGVGERRAGQEEDHRRRRRRLGLTALLDTVSIRIPASPGYLAWCVSSPPGSRRDCASRSTRSRTSRSPSTSSLPT